MPRTNVAASPRAAVDVKDVYRRYLAVLECQWQEVQRDFPAGPARDARMRHYPRLPFEHFEAVMQAAGKLSAYLIQLERAEFAINNPDLFR